MWSREDKFDAFFGSSGTAQTIHDVIAEHSAARSAPSAPQSSANQQEAERTVEDMVEEACEPEQSVLEVGGTTECACVWFVCIYVSSTRIHALSCCVLPLASVTLSSEVAPFLQ